MLTGPVLMPPPLGRVLLDAPSFGGSTCARHAPRAAHWHAGNQRCIL